MSSYQTRMRRTSLASALSLAGVLLVQRNNSKHISTRPHYQYDRHTHDRTHSIRLLGEGRELCIIPSASVLHGYPNPITAYATLSKVVLLKVERGLGESIAVVDLLLISSGSIV